MSVSRIGVNPDDFRLGTKEGLRRAAGMSFRAVELGAIGEIDPVELSKTGRRHLSRFVEGLGLQLTALTADFGALRLSDPATVDQRVEQTERVLELAADMSVPVVSAGVGALSSPEQGEPSPLAMEALARLGEFADTRGVRYALRPQRETGVTLAAVLDHLGCPAIGVCLDPAAIVMSGANPLAAVERWAERIALVYARDGSAGMAEQSGQETRLGEGEVDLLGLLATLDAAEYPGAYILRRKQSQTPVEDIQAAQDLMQRYLPPT